MIQEHEYYLWKPIGYWSGLHCDAERRHGTTQKERLTKVWTVFMQRPYLEESHSIIKTDCQALR